MRSRLLSLLIIPLLSVVGFLSLAGATGESDVFSGNQLLSHVLQEEEKNLPPFLARRGSSGGPNTDFDLYLPPRDLKPKIKPPTADEMNRDQATFALAMSYYGEQGNDRFFGTFIESGAPVTDGYQWNTQKSAGILDPILRRKALDRAKAAGLKNIRIGVNLQDLDLKDSESAHDIVEFCRDAWARGISPTISILFFPSLKRWEVLDAWGHVDARRSYLQNLNFARGSGELAAFILTQVKKALDQFNEKNEPLAVTDRLPKARIAVNPVNEAETLAGFNGQFWHGALARWADPNVMRLYVPAIINIAAASVEIRLAVEKVFGAERILKIENPAMTTADYPSHQGDLQFAVNKLILGDDDLMNANFENLKREPLDDLQHRVDAQRASGQINVVDASILKYTFIPANRNESDRERARDEVIGRLVYLRDAHRKLRVPAKTDTMLMADYYQQSEFILPRSVPQLIKELSANNGVALKRVMQVQSDINFIASLKEWALKAEKSVGQKIWSEGQVMSEVELIRLLSQEDAIVLDKIIGLRNEWSFVDESAFHKRRERAGIHAPDFFEGTDEKRSDALLDTLLAENGALLKSSLGARDSKALIAKLTQAGRDTRLGGESVTFSESESLRSILNKSERTILHRLYGLKRERRLGFLPPTYARQIRAGLRRGFYSTFVTYVNELGLRVGGIGEMGTPYYPWGSLVLKQMVLELVRGAEDLNFSIVRFDCGPMIGTIGWVKGPLTKSIKENGERASDGIFKLVQFGGQQSDYQFSAWQTNTPFFVEFRRDLLSALSRAQESLEKFRHDD